MSNFLIFFYDGIYYNIFILLQKIYKELKNELPETKIAKITSEWKYKKAGARNASLCGWFDYAAFCKAGQGH